MAPTLPRAVRRLLPDEPPPPTRVPFEFSSTVDGVSQDTDDESAEYFEELASEDECEDCGELVAYDCVCGDVLVQELSRPRRREFLRQYRARVKSIFAAMQLRFDRRDARRRWFRVKQHVMRRSVAFYWFGVVVERRCAPDGVDRAADARAFRAEHGQMCSRKRPWDSQ